MTDAATTNGHAPEALREALIELLGDNEALREALDAAMLELALEDSEWRRLSAQGATEFSKSGIDRAAELGRLMAIKNPLVKRGLEVQGNYVFGQGVTIRARAPELAPIVAAFVARNRDQLFGLQIQVVRDRELACDGNLFLALFTDPMTGAVTVRPVPLIEIVDIVTDPEDRATPRYYRRRWQETRLTAGGATETVPREAYYPDWRYRPQDRPERLGDIEVRWGSPIYHVAVGAFSNWLYGLSEIYAAIDWARAYKSFLEDWATITRALSRFAWKRVTGGGARGVAAARRQLASTLGTGAAHQAETNPPPVTGAVAVMGQGEDLVPIKTAGATTSMDDGRRLLLMVAAAQGLPETFYGDASVGTLATAHSLDRPTELKMGARQQLWREVYDDLCGYQLLASARAPRGEVRRQRLGRVARDGLTGEMVVWATVAGPGGDARPIDATIEQDWPPIVDPDPQAEVATIATAAARIPDPRLIVRLLLRALRVPDADALIAAMFPEGESDARAPTPGGDNAGGDDEPGAGGEPAA